MTRRLVSRAASALSIGGFALAVACGIPPDEQPEVTSQRNVPFDLLEPGATTTTTAATADPLSTVPLCLYDGDNLVTIGREMATSGMFDSLQALEQRTTAEERELGLETAMRGPDTVRSATVVAGVARVDLSASFGALPAEEQLRVVAQVVCTATSRPGVGQVLFTLEGAPIDVPRGDGSLSAGAVTRDDYPRIVPTPPS